MNIISQAIILILMFRISYPFIAYDCNVKNMSVIRFSTIDDYNCPIPTENISKKGVNIQLIQRADVGMIHVIQCKIKITRIINYCGMSSHNSMVSNGFASYIKEIGLNNCQDLHQHLSFQYNNNIIIDMIKHNATITSSIQFSGKIDNSGKCTGSFYSDYYGSWDNVIVSGIIEISLSDYYSTYSLHNDIIHLRSGIQCKYSRGTCMDSELGETYWDPIKIDICHSNNYDVLYQGPSTEIKELSLINNNTTVKTYLVETDQYVFGLSVTKYISSCGQIIWQTEHPKLLIIIDNGQGFIYDKKELIIPNMDLFTYVNSKFLYIEQHFRKQITSMYNDLIQQRCKIEKQVIKSLQTTARTNPNEFALIYMNAPGYTAQTIGSMITLIKCQPVDVKLAQTSVCYNELPVEYLNTTYYMNANNLILQSIGTEVVCNDIVYGGFKIGVNWYAMNPRRYRIEDPSNLTLDIHNRWEYSYPQHLADSGIYSQNDLNQLKDHIMFPLERPAIENAISKKVMGIQLQNPYIDMSSLVDKDYIKNTVSDFLSSSWSIFTHFGTITSGLLGIYMIIHLIKYMLTTTVNGYTLYKTLGCGLHLFASLFTCLTSAVMHMSYRQVNTVIPPSTELEIVTSNENCQDQNVITSLSQSVANNPSNNQKSVYPAIPRELQ